MITSVIDARPCATDSVDLSVLNSFDDPDMGGDAGLIIELIDLYQAEATNLVDHIRTGLQNDDWPAVKRAAHSLRGSSSNLGILQMALIADDLEHLPLNDTTAAGSLLFSMEQELIRVYVILDEERNRRSV
jgi:HPt (histidine-containing phosphotransfer) domain-containing protein